MRAIGRCCAIGIKMTERETACTAYQMPKYRFHLIPKHSQVYNLPTYKYFVTKLSTVKSKNCSHHINKISQSTDSYFVT